MRAEGCREWRESLGAYVLGRLSDGERAAIEAHLDGCPDCRAELDSLEAISRLLPLADPERVGAPAPAPPTALADRVMTAISGERKLIQRRRWRRRGLALGGVAAAATAAVLAIFVLSDSENASPAQHVSFSSLPADLKIGATLEPHAFGTEIHVYVKGARSGSLCRVFLRARDGSRMPAGSFRYRWGDDSQAILSSALDLSRTDAIGVQVGNRTFIAPVGGPGATGPKPSKEDTT